MSPSIQSPSEITLHDLHPAPDDLRGEVIAGLGNEAKTLPCKYFYDAKGSRLFDQICDLDEYYVTRTERAILEENAKEIGLRIGRDALVVELGSGSSEKTPILLGALEGMAGYVPVDISRDHLMAAAHRIRARFPSLRVSPVCADFTESFSLPDGLEDGRRFVFFPGSTIGNFDADGRTRLLERAAALTAGTGGGLLIGIDLIKDRGRLEAAYDDAAGVTAAFNLNLLDRINRELGANFAVDRFEHRAVFNAEESRIEMHLVSGADQVASVGGHDFSFREGETICTEHSYKFSIDGFTEQAGEAGFERVARWTDPEDLFSVLLFEMA